MDSQSAKLCNAKWGAGDFAFAICNLALPRGLKKTALISDS
jgi:hypothetical protein